MTEVLDLTTTISSVSLQNPTILASGILDEDAGSMKRVVDAGAAAVVTKSIGLHPREGHPNPSFVELDHGILNALGLPNPGIHEYEEEIRKLKNWDITVIGSIFGSTAQEFVSLAKKMQSFNVDALELNLSCPHAKGYGLEIGQNPQMVKKIVADVKDAVHIPVFAKLSANVSDITTIARAAAEGNADAIVAINTVKAMKINLDLQLPVLANKFGGYSGKAIKPIGVRCVYEIASQIDIPVIGVGGITTGEDALEYLMAGATAVEIGSAVYYRGVDVFKKICEEIKQWMKKHGFKTIEELIGVAHQ